MKLLFDQNLSRLLVGVFAEEFPDSVHVTDAGLERATDREVWEFARAGGPVIVPRDPCDTSCTARAWHRAMNPDGDGAAHADPIPRASHEHHRTPR